MEIKPVKSEEYRSYDAARIRETEVTLRKALTDLHLDVYSPLKSGGKMKIIRRNLARLLTVRTEKARQQPKTKSKAKVKGSK